LILRSEIGVFNCAIAEEERPNAECQRTLEPARLRPEPRVTAWAAAQHLIAGLPPAPGLEDGFKISNIFGQVSGELSTRTSDWTRRSAISLTARSMSLARRLFLSGS
jgi:hypothetical protein